MQHRAVSTLVLLAFAAATSLACDSSDGDDDRRLDLGATIDVDAPDDLVAPDAAPQREPTVDELDGRARPIDEPEDGNAPSGVDDFGIDVDPQAGGYSSGWHAIVNARSGLCLDVQNASTSMGAVVGQYWCHHRANQQWEFQYFYTQPYGPATYFRIRNRNSGLCLDMVNSALTQQPCGNWSTQRFDNAIGGNGVMVLRNYTTNNCLDVPDAMIDPVNVNRFACHNGTNQQWLYTVQDEPFDCR